MAAEDAQYLASLGVTHLLNTASGDNYDGVKFVREAPRKGNPN